MKDRTTDTVLETVCSKLTPGSLLGHILKELRCRESSRAARVERAKIDGKDAGIPLSRRPSPQAFMNFLRDHDVTGNISSSLAAAIVACVWFIAQLLLLWLTIRIFNY